MWGDIDESLIRNMIIPEISSPLAYPLPVNASNRAYMTSFPVVYKLWGLDVYPETPEVFCGLTHFTHPSIDIVLSG